MDQSEDLDLFSVMKMDPPTGQIFKLKLVERFGNVKTEEDAMTPLNANGNDTTVSE